MEVTAPALFLVGMLCAYLAGSVNFAILVFKFFGRQDPRTYYSGNPGVTNVFRQAGWTMAALVLVLDMGRAVAVALLALNFWADPLVPWAGFGLILGNRYPCFHGFQGGKGVANFLGFYLLLLPLGAGVAVAAYLLVFAAVRIPFVASFGLVAVLTAFGLYRWGYAVASVSAVLITMGSIVWFHRGNIAELVKRRKER